MQERSARVEEIEMRWLERGSGPPVVFVHGIATSPELWRHVLPLVSSGRLLAWEMVGYGRSWRQGEDRDIAVRAQAGYLRAWLDSQQLERAVLVGHDLGGGVAQILAVEHPDRCAGLVLSNSIAYDSWPIAMVKAIRRLGAVVERLPARMLRSLLRGFIRPGHDNRARAEESFQEHWRGYDHHRGAAAFIRQVRSLRTQDTLAIADRLREIDVPARLVWGAADRFQTIDYGRRLAADLRAELEPLAEAKHFVPEDHPEPLAAAVEHVLLRL